MWKTGLKEIKDGKAFIEYSSCIRDYKHWWLQPK